MHRLCVGVDVGLSSAAAAVYGYAGGQNVPRLITTTTIRTTGEDAAKRIDVEWFWDWLVGTGAKLAYVENATAMPSQDVDPKTGKRRAMGAGGMARYLRAAGAIEATVTLAGLDTVRVMPGQWQRQLGLTEMRRGLTSDNERKKRSVILARQVFPEHADTTFKYFNSHNESDASLIALYAAIRTNLVSLQRTAA